MRTSSLLFAISVTILSGPGRPVFADGKDLEIRSGHNLLAEAGEDVALPVGSPVGELAFKDISGKSYYLSDSLAKGPAVFVFLGTECPLAKRYTTRLERLRAEYAPRGVAFFAVHSNSDESKDAVAAHARKMGYAFPVVHDSSGYLARRLGGTMTPQIFVIDREGVLRYRGAIDDHRYENRVRKRYARDALESVLSGKPVEVAQTKTLGCTLHLDDRVPAKGKVTYARHIARILQDNCQRCHRPGQVAPFSLIGYEKARTWADEIKAYTGKRLMPPWKAAPGFGEFKHDTSLSDSEIRLIARWVDEGTPLGDAEDLPPPARFKDGWALGEPDLVVEMPEEYRVAPEGEDDYRHFIIPTSFDRDRFVEAIDVRPGNRGTVHHVIVYVDTSGKARELDAADPGPGYTRFGDVGFKVVSMLGGWAPGTRPAVLPRGTGRWLPKGGDIVLQVHYYRTGAWETDRTRCGLYFSESPHPKPVRTAAAINSKFTIPPGEKRYEVHARLKVDEPVYALSVFPHMHLLGREMKVVAKLPDGGVRPLIWIKDWDFNWQSGYFFKDMIYLPKDTVVEQVSYFDNSSDNPNNPHNPPRPVGWGEKTTDEMSIAFVSYLKASDYSPEIEN